MTLYGSNPWLKSYKLGPFDLATSLPEYPQTPFFFFFDQVVTKYGNSPACLYEGRVTTYRELSELVSRLAAGLKSLGVEQGDRVATILNTSPQYIIADLAIEKTGAVHVPCCPLHTARELTHEISESQARTVICLEALAEKVKSILPDTSVKDVITAADEDFSATQQTIIERPGALQLRELIERSDPQPPQVDINAFEDLALLAFTGGATGRPKAVMLTHHNIVSNTMQSLPWIMAPLEKGIVGRSSLLLGIPAFHAYGQWAIRAALFWGLNMILMPDPRDAAGIAAQLKAHSPLMAALVPTQYMRLVDHVIGRTNTSFLSGTAPLPPDVTARFKKVTGMPITEGYGLTETGPMTHFNLSSFAKITGFMPFEKKSSLGVPCVGTEARLVDPVVGSQVPVGEVGELYVKGPQIMKGYWPTPGAGLADGWLPTGDLCKMDEDGYFYLVDRSKDMINASGNKVYSVAVDEVLFEHPAVSLAVAIGIPDPDRPGSERVKAFVVLRGNSQGKVTPDDLIAYCKEKLSPYAVPKWIEFRESLPMTVTGKLFKKQLRDEEIAKAGLQI